MIVLAATAYEIPSEIEKIVNAGVNDCLIKPLSIDTVNRVLEKYLK